MSDVELEAHRQFNLKISNPNSSDLLNVSLRLVWPEAIVTVESGDLVPPYELTAIRDLDKTRPILKGVNGLTLEPLPEQATGLWLVAIDHLPANSLSNVRVVTTRGEASGLYGVQLPDLAESRLSGELLWAIDLDYQVSGVVGVQNQRLVYGIGYDWERREATATVVSPTVARVRVRQGAGWRVPGLFATQGYVLATGPAELSFDQRPKPKGVGGLKGFRHYSAPVMLERLNDIRVYVGVEGGNPPRPTAYVEGLEPKTK